MSMISNLDREQIKSRILGSKFRPLHWSDIYAKGVPIVGWGISEKPLGRRSYIPRGWEGKVHPFKSKIEAKRLCDELNTLAQDTQGTQGTQVIDAQAAQPA